MKKAIEDELCEVTVSRVLEETLGGRKMLTRIIPVKPHVKIKAEEVVKEMRYSKL